MQGARGWLRTVTTDLVLCGQRSSSCPKAGTVLRTQNLTSNPQRRAALSRQTAADGEERLAQHEPPDRCCFVRVRLAPAFCRHVLNGRNDAIKLRQTTRIASRSASMRTRPVRTDRTIPATDESQAGLGNSRFDLAWSYG